MSAFTFCALCLIAQAVSSLALRLPDSPEVQQVKKECPLPSHGRWCQVHPQGSAPGFQMAVVAKDDYVSDHICKEGVWGDNGHPMDVAALGKPGNAVDIGANIGWYSFLLANAGWNVHSFEPMTSNVALINATLCQNPTFLSKIKVYHTALGAHDDNCVMISAKTNTANGHIRCGKEGQEIRKNGGIKQMCGLDGGCANHPESVRDFVIRGEFPVRRFDDIMKQEGAPKSIDFMKIDVEGFELQVFAGGKSILGSFRPKLIKTEVGHNMADGGKPQDYLKMFMDAHYKISTTVDGEHPVGLDAYDGVKQTDVWVCRE